MKKKIFIHVGYPKTGTTTLQKHFFPKIEEIQYLGKRYRGKEPFLFEQSVINTLIFNKFDTIHFDAIQAVFDEVIYGNCSILSEESILFNSLRTSRIGYSDITPLPSEIAKNFREAFHEEKFDVNIIFSIRKQDEMVTSLYAQSYTHYYAKYKAYDTFEKFLSLFLNQQTHPFRYALDYNAVIGEFQALFGKKNIHVMVFEKLQKKPEQFYQNLCQILGVDFDKYSNVLSAKQENRRSTDVSYKKTRPMSLYHFLLAMKRKYFDIPVKLTEKQTDWLKSIRVGNNDKLNKTIVLTQEQKEALMQKYEYGNRELSKQFDLDLGRFGYFHDK
jgi:hypothetical protein